MAGYFLPPNLKRKNSELANHDFSDFSLSSPATKIRRLDAELLPISEEEGMEVPIVDHYEPDHYFGGGECGSGRGRGRGVVIEELPSELENEERAIVLFKPVNSPLVASPSNFSVTVNPQLMSGFKNQMMCTYQQPNLFRQADNGGTETDENSGTKNDCMAVVPWVPSQVPSGGGWEISSQNDVDDMMDADEMETTTMEVEDSNGAFEPSGTALNEGIHQWQQQHCMIPQLPQNLSAPVVWFR